LQKLDTSVYVEKTNGPKVVLDKSDFLGYQHDQDKLRVDGERVEIKNLQIFQYKTVQICDELKISFVPNLSTSSSFILCAVFEGLSAVSEVQLAFFWSQPVEFNAAKS